MNYAIAVEKEVRNVRILLTYNITMTLMKYIDLIRLYLVAAGTKELIQFLLCLYLREDSLSEVYGHQ